MVLTFAPHPVQVLNPGYNFLFLTNPEEKLKWFESVGVEHLVILEFTRSFAELSPEEFVDRVLFQGLGLVICLLENILCLGRGGQVMR